MRSLFSYGKLLLSEGLEPRRAAAAVFLGVFIAVVPIYGFQSLVALGLATLLRLNKPLTFGATFVNNPLFQPFLIFFSLEVGHYILTGNAWSIPVTGITGAMLREQLTSWIIGSVVLGAVLGAVAASAACLLIRLRSPEAVRGRKVRRETIRFIRSHYKWCPNSARGFVRWKTRLDRIFGMLALEDLGNGDVVDLGCGYGMTLALAAFQQPGRRLIGCDLDAHRVEIAQNALSPMRAVVSVKDIRFFAFSGAGLVMIMDVLQYLDPAEQRELLTRCCSSLLPGGRLIFRVHDRGRGVPGKLSLALDRLIFRMGGCATRPTILNQEDYRQILQSVGMKVRMKRFINRIPLAHILVISERPHVDNGRIVTVGGGIPTPAGS